MFLLIQWYLHGELFQCILISLSKERCIQISVNGFFVYSKGVSVNGFFCCCFVYSKGVCTLWFLKILIYRCSRVHFYCLLFSLQFPLLPKRIGRCDNVHICAVLSAVTTELIAPRVFMSFVFCTWVFLNFLCSQAFLIYLSYIILIVLVFILLLCKFGYFSYKEYFVSDDLLSRISFWPFIKQLNFVNSVYMVQKMIV